MSLQLYFVRHAIAVPHGSEGFVEEERPLTEEGRQKMQRAAQGIRNLKLIPEVIFTSPLVRALQTAEILQSQLGKKENQAIPVEVDKLLSPGGDVEDFLRKLKDRKEEAVMLVGHEPSMSSWVQNLLGCDPTGSILLKKGSLCHLELTWVGARPIVELVALLQPRMLRQID